MYNEALGGHASETYEDALETFDMVYTTLSKSAGVSEVEARELAIVGIAIVTPVTKN
jgi:hypothetical protein